ncbi:hypothetical protein O8E88_001092 [Flavobacterium psychrophilum]|uniref:hypothetical protein n=1 Tax=Flavobacterium psychrophilum TaxID=96345 RepID=UPI0004F822B1|nr:hypothetical protein [Flavobacterium psychrophilum]AIN73391.1 hypothetical protein FPG3_02655 [Flavobacterium psychrophilum FPG3]EKT2069295.1 hypothetical protein [Flavobacterium psychrophilum]EKT2071559.1 hypothetical protein [Flavobacterium psychrophilum]EKT4491080.1 hypothetical protein [Flavobacterium psychrophilum]MBF2044590.1 hypothetical protein [Flavobacterium psychrophilum]
MKLIKLVLIPIIFALLLRISFGATIFNDFLSVMTWTFFLLVPAGIGALFIYFSPIEKVKSIAYRILAPWIPIILVIALTIVIGLEGWACWIMISPLFLIFASIGGLIAGHFKNKKNENLNISILVLLPFLIGPIENAIPRNAKTYTTYTSIEINSDAQTIWNNVTAVKEIKSNEDNSKLISWLGFPKPIKAELDTLAVGGYRKAIFQKGLIFNETVTKYENLKLMEFQIKANTYEIPSTTLDEHILIGGEYFDMLNGTYKLKKISTNKYNLILYSNFSMKTTFNSYASIWGNWIMKDIQNNILNVIKRRSEKIVNDNNNPNN